jgi:hypothetical protein
MTWQDVKDWLEPFVLGLVIGYAWNPIWAILKKIWYEANLAKKEWRKPHGKPD